MVILTILVVAGAAALYFTVMNKPEPSPEGTVRTFFSALSSSDSATLKSLYVAGAQPSDEMIGAMASAYRMFSVKWSNLLLKTISQTASAASVEVLDATISASLSGNSKTQQLADILARDGGAQPVFTLKLENGKWLIVNDAGMMNPNGPGTT